MSWEIIRWIDGTGRVQMCETKEVAEGFLEGSGIEEKPKENSLSRLDL